MNCMCINNNDNPVMAASVNKQQAIYRVLMFLIAIYTNLLFDAIHQIFKKYYYNEENTDSFKKILF